MKAGDGVIFVFTHAQFSNFCTGISVFMFTLVSMFFGKLEIFFVLPEFESKIIFGSLIFNYAHV